MWLFAGLVACAALAWQYRRFDHGQRIALAQFVSARLLPKLTSSISGSRKLVKRILFILGVAFVFIALARPQAGFEFQETHRKGLELLFAVDTSKSMLAQDVKPDRLTRAKLAVTDLIAKLNGDGVGLIAFAGSSFLQCPVTLDYDAFRESLDALDVNVIPRGGTDIAAAIHEAEAVFKTRTVADKILILITDGEDLGGEAISAAQSAAKNGVKIFTVGVGSTTGELVPVPSETGGTDFAREANGQLVKSHLDETTLKKIADATGGIYQPLGAHGEGLTNIYERSLAGFTRQDLKAREAKVPLEKFHWALLAALACFVGELLVGNRRKRRGSNLRPAAAAAALIILAGVASTKAASPQSAEQAYQKGDFAKSQQDYAASAAKEPTKAELQFNTGDAAYKAGDYTQAVSGFEKSLKTGQVPVQQSAYYNLGNTKYRLGQKTEKEDPQETIKTWEEAVKSYDTALQIRADDADAKHNRDLVQKKIEQLKKQEQQKKQDQQQQQNQKDQQQNKDQKNNDQQNQSQDQRSDSKDQKGEGKDQQPQDSKNQQGDSKEQKDSQKGGAGDQKKEPKDSKGGDKEQKPNESKDQNGEGKKEQPKDQQGSGQEKKDEPKDQKGGASKPEAGQDKKDQQPQQADAKSGKGKQQPKPVDPANKPSKGDAQAANGEKPEDAQAGTAAEERREPGELTKEEAKQLLDALKNDDRKVPAISQDSRAAQQPNDQKILKDW
jgi:Ca-activated chloride channel family protein